jgi:hypothetical protein
MAPLFLTSALHGAQFHSPVSIPPVKIACGAHFIVGLVSLRPGLEAMEENLFPLQGIEPRSSSPSLYPLNCVGC